MCGIVGVYAPSATVSSTLLKEATSTLYHRGPDGQRQWISSDAHVGLGHARLSIIDLATGDQPIASEDGLTHIVVNGEFYGYESIQRELEAKGHRLRTRSDSEIALHLWEDYGPQCLHWLRGEFAIILWDAKERCLFIARDRFGIKPLFYAWHNGALYIASEVKALFAAGVPARWDHESFFHGGNSYPTRTLYDGVFQIPPGHYALATEKHFQVSRYWDFNYPAASDAALKRSPEDYIAEFHDVLDEAVRIRLRADVPVGVYLSGGLDSCSVLGLAARHRTDPIRAFTLTFEHAAYDEGSIAREMAARANAEIHSIPVRQTDLADAFTDAVVQSETFCVNAHGVAKYLLSKAVRDAGFKVVLTGEGADETLGGYPHFRRDMLLYNREGQDPEAIGQLLNALDETNTVSRGLLLPDGEHGKLEYVKRVLGYIPSWIEAFSTRDMKTLPLLSRKFSSIFEQHEPYRAFLAAIDVNKQLNGRDPIHQSLYLWCKSVLPSYILTVLGDRMEMGHSIEGRVPFLDHQVVECLCAQPVSMKIRGMTEKYVLREAVRDVITDTVYRRQKHPFLSPPSTLTPGERFYDFVQDTLRGPSLAAVPFYEQSAVIALLDRLPEMDDGARIATDQVLMTITSACVLQEGFSLSG